MGPTETKRELVRGKNVKKAKNERKWIPRNVNPCPKLATSQQLPSPASCPRAVTLLAHLSPHRDPHDPLHLGLGRWNVTHSHSLCPVLPPGAAWPPKVQCVWWWGASLARSPALGVAGQRLTLRGPGHPLSADVAGRCFDGGVLRALVTFPFCCELLR